MFFRPDFTRCAHLMQGGGVIAYPTEGVWGLGCDPFHAPAVRHILRLKKRKVEKGLILISGNPMHFAPLLAGLAPELRAKISDGWPDHTTWLVPHRGQVPEFISGASDSVAIRVSAHPVVKALTNAFGGAIVSTSANPAGLPSARTSLKVRCYFGKRIAALAPGQVGGENGASKIIDALTGDILRS